MPNLRAWTAIAVALVVAAAANARAAQIHADLNDVDKPCQITVAGKIVPGDFARLKAALGNDYEPSFAGPTMCLNSPGGDFVEALKVADFVSKGISTTVGENAKCISACAWIFMAGTSLATGGVRTWTRIMDAKAALAFHAPYLDPASFVNSPGSNVQTTIADTIAAYNQAVAELAKGLLHVAQRYDSPATSPLVPSSLLAEALLHVGPDDLLRIDTVQSAVRWGINVGGYASVVPKSREDLVRGCILASDRANQWSPLPNPSLQYEEFQAFFDSEVSTLTVQLVISGIGGLACELRLHYSDDFKTVRSIDVVANLNKGSFTEGWIKGTRESVSMEMPDFAILPPQTLLQNLPQTLGPAIDPHRFVTLDRPAWCTAQATKGREEVAICGDARLSAMDVVLGRLFQKAMKNFQGQWQANTFKSEQINWIAKRRGCADDTECLTRLYLSRIDDLRIPARSDNSR
jgi:uncharacterized protein YecT (DUF1311 family)